MSLPSRCYDCRQRADDGRYVLLHCECGIALCKNCARYRLGVEKDPFIGVLKCPKCSEAPIPPVLRKGVQQVVGIEEARSYRKELLICAYEHFNLASNRRNSRERLLSAFNDEGYLQFLDIGDLSEDKKYFVDLCLARAEVHRQTQQWLPDDHKDKDKEKKCLSLKNLPLGPLEKVDFKHNGTLALALKLEEPLDDCCLGCCSQIKEGKSMIFACECFSAMCQDCARRLVGALPDTYRETDACPSADTVGIPCPLCREYSVTVTGAIAAREEETRLVEQALKRCTRDKPRSAKGTRQLLKTCHDWFLSRDIKGVFETQYFVDFVENGSNGEINEVQVRLEIARLEAEWELRQSSASPPSSSSTSTSTKSKKGDVQQQREDECSFGPLNKLKFIRNIFLEIASASKNNRNKTKPPQANDNDDEGDGGGGYESSGSDWGDDWDSDTASAPDHSSSSKSDKNGDGDEATYTICPQCGKVLASNSGLARHISVSHPQPMSGTAFSSALARSNESLGGARGRRLCSLQTTAAAASAATIATVAAATLVDNNIIVTGKRSTISSSNLGLSRGPVSRANTGTTLRGRSKSNHINKNHNARCRSSVCRQSSGIDEVATGSPADTKHACPMCEKSYQNNQNLRRHILYKHPENEFDSSFFLHGRRPMDASGDDRFRKISTSSSGTIDAASAAEEKGEEGEERREDDDDGDDVSSIGDEWSCSEDEVLEAEGKRATEQLDKQIEANDGKQKETGNHDGGERDAHRDRVVAGEEYYGYADEEACGMKIDDSWGHRVLSQSPCTTELMVLEGPEDLLKMSGTEGSAQQASKEDTEQLAPVVAESKQAFQEERVGYSNVKHRSAKEIAYEEYQASIAGHSELSSRGVSHHHQHHHRSPIGLELFHAEEEKEASEEGSEEGSANARRRKSVVTPAADDSSASAITKTAAAEVSTESAAELKGAGTAALGYDDGDIGNGNNFSDACGGTIEAAAVVEELEGGDCEEDLILLQCNECARWVHAPNESEENETQFESMAARETRTADEGGEYLCPLCRVSISERVIAQLRSADTLRIFAYPVTEEVAKNYFDIIRNPMDLSTMSHKAQRGHYKSMQSLRQDFELTCLNALIFNQPSDMYWQEARAFEAKGQAIFRTLNRRTISSAFGAEAIEIIRRYKDKLLAEQQASRRVAIEARKRFKELSIALKRALKVANKGNEPSLSLLGEALAAAETAGLDAAAVDAFYNKIVAKRDLEVRLDLALAAFLRGEIQMDDATLASSIATDATSAASSTVAAVAAAGAEGDKIVAGDTSVSAADGDAAAAAAAAAEDPICSTIVLPSELSNPIEPPSYIPCVAHMSSAEDAFFNCALDQCLLCGSAGSAGFMIFCIDCGETFHSFCADAPLATMTPSQRLLWRCTNCTICEVCSEGNETDANCLLYCELCDRAFHMRCVHPKMDEVPCSDWFCADCVDCRPCKQTAPTETINKGTSPDISSRRSWGTSSSVCALCEVAEEERKAWCPVCKLTFKDGRAVSQAERLALSGGVFCPHRSPLVTECSQCHVPLHPHCNPDLCLPWIPSLEDHILCRPCLAKTVTVTASAAATATSSGADGAAQVTSSSTSDTGDKGEKGGGGGALEELILLKKENRIQTIQRVKDRKRVRENGIQAVLVTWEKQRSVLKAIIQWASKRAARWQSSQEKLEESAEVILDWLYHRAKRFAAFFRRSERRREDDDDPTTEVVNSDEFEVDGDDSETVKAKVEAPGVTVAYSTSKPSSSSSSSSEPTRKPHFKKSNKEVDNRILIRQSSMQCGLGPDGRELDTNALLQLARLAAAFILATNVNCEIDLQDVSIQELADLRSIIDPLLAAAFRSRVQDPQPKDFHRREVVRHIKLACHTLNTRWTPEKKNAQLRDAIEAAAMDTADFDTNTTSVFRSNASASIKQKHSSNVESGGCVTGGGLHRAAAKLEVADENDGDCDDYAANGEPLILIRQKSKRARRISSSVAAAAAAEDNGVKIVGHLNDHDIQRVVAGMESILTANAVSVENGPPSGTMNKRRGRPPKTKDNITPPVVTCASSSASSSASAADVSRTIAAVDHGESDDEAIVTAAGGGGGTTKKKAYFVSVDLTTGEGHFARKSKLFGLPANCDDVAPTEVTSARLTVAKTLKSLFGNPQRTGTVTSTGTAAAATAIAVTAAESNLALQSGTGSTVTGSSKAVGVLEEAVFGIEEAALLAGRSSCEPSTISSGIGSDTHPLPDNEEGLIASPALAALSQAMHTAHAQVTSEIDARFREAEAAEAAAAAAARESNHIQIHKEKTSASDNLAKDVTLADNISAVEEQRVSQVTDGISASSLAASTDTVEEDMVIVSEEDEVVGGSGGGTPHDDSPRDSAPTIAYAPCVNSSSSAHHPYAEPGHVPRLTSSTSSSTVAVSGSGVEAMSGWTYGTMGEIPWRDVRYCSLCQSANEASEEREVIDFSSSDGSTQPPAGLSIPSVTTKAYRQKMDAAYVKSSGLGDDSVCGRLLPLPEGRFAHANCLRWSGEVVERDGRLVNATQELKRGYHVLCTFCRENGATIGCRQGNCRRSYHLKCALASHCTFMEARLNTESPNHLHDVYTLMACPEHSISTIDKSKLYRRWLPSLSDPTRFVTIDENEDISSGLLAEWLSQSTGTHIERPVRCGSLTVMNVGQPRIDMSGFHTADIIYPHRFRAARIYWSMYRPLYRTVYMFEVLAMSDLGNRFDESSLLENNSPERAVTTSSSAGACANSSSATTNRKRGLHAVPSENSAPIEECPIFRIVALDAPISSLGSPDRPILTRSLQLAYDTIRQHSQRQTDSAFEILKIRHSPRSSSETSKLLRGSISSLNPGEDSTFGLNATQFFGLGLPFCRIAIEMIPESCAAVLAESPLPQYRPCYRLPSTETAVCIKHKLLALARAQDLMEFLD